MKRHQIALSLLFIVLPFFVIAFLTVDASQSGENTTDSPTPEYISPCTDKSREAGRDGDILSDDQKPPYGKPATCHAA